MSEEEKEILHYLEGAIDTYIEGTKVTKVEMSVKDDEILLNYIDKLQKVIDLMATELSRRPLMIYLDNERDDRLVILDNSKEIIKYYTKKAEEEK